MTCDFKPGDEVVCFRHHEEDGPVHLVPCPPIGHVGVVTAIGDGFPDPWLELDNWPTHPDAALTADMFRKVERKTDKRSLTEWLSQPAGDTDNLDKPIKQPAKVRERG